MKRKLFTTAALLCCFLAGFATITTMSGTWTGLLKTDDGDQYQLKYDFKIVGDKLTGTAQTPKGQMPIKDGEIKGETFTFYVAIGKLEIEHTGRFYGDSVGVDLALGDAHSHATLVRAK